MGPETYGVFLSEGRRTWPGTWQHHSCWDTRAHWISARAQDSPTAGSHLPWLSGLLWWTVPRLILLQLKSMAFYLTMEEAGVSECCPQSSMAFIKLDVPQPGTCLLMGWRTLNLWTWNCEVTVWADPWVYKKTCSLKIKNTAWPPFSTFQPSKESHRKANSCCCLIWVLTHTTCLPMHLQWEGSLCVCARVCVSVYIHVRALHACDVFALSHLRIPVFLAHRDPFSLTWLFW